MVDELYLQRGQGLKLGDNITVKHPTLGDIVDYTSQYGEDYYQGLSMLTSEILDYAVVLWCDNKVWYEDIESEYSFFLQRAFSNSTKAQCFYGTEIESVPHKIEVELTLANSSLRNILNFFLGTQGNWCFVQQPQTEKSNAQMYLANLTEENVLEEKSLRFTEHYYKAVAPFLKKIHHIRKDGEETHFTNIKRIEQRKWAMEQTYVNMKKKKKNKPSVDMASINSALIAKGIQDTWNMPLYLFYDLYYRYIKFNEYDNTMTALYSGNIDTKKKSINHEKIHWASVINHN